MLSHDLRNPLNVALGRLELVEADDEDENLEAVEGALERIERLIQDMLTLAREGEAVGATEQVNLKVVAEQTCANVETKSATLEIETEGQIETDFSRLSQMFENLFRNAIEHGGDDVTVRVGRTRDGFYVEDTGPGISENERDDVLDSGYTTKREGTGFGPAIVKRIVEAHGWEIYVTEGSDGGARFEITGVAQS